MGLTTALYTGLSGLNVNQIGLDVAGNNIANVNTTSFKASRALYKTLFSVTSNFGTPPSGGMGGTNAIQQGMGATLGTIQRNFSPGNIQSTGKSSDVAIQGEGMFIVQGETTGYTRNGAFQLNSQNMLVDGSGNFVMGYGIDSGFNVIDGSLQKLNIPLGQMTTANSTSNVSFSGSLKSSGNDQTSALVLNSNKFHKADATAVTDTTLLTDLRDSNGAMFSVGSTIHFTGSRGGRKQAERDLVVQAGTTVKDLGDLMVDGFGINTGATAAPPPGAAVKTDGAGNYFLEITGNVGVDNRISVDSGGFQVTNVTSTPTGPMNFTTVHDAAGESVYTSMTVYDSLGTPLRMDVTMVLQSKKDEGTTWEFFVNSPDSSATSTSIGLGSVSYDNRGQYKTSTGTTAVLDRQGTGAITPLTIALDFSNTQGLTVDKSQIFSFYQDGVSAGTLDSFSVAEDGKIIGTFNNGMVRTLGQLGVATFSNYEGLVDTGGGTYTAGPNSGEAIVGIPLANGAGSITGGALEGSNVDISNEFINLITASTGFSASSRVITTSNQLLTELLGMMR